MHLVPACVSWALRWHPAPPAAAVKAILATNLPTNDSSGYGCEAAASGSGLAGGLGRFRGLVLDPLTSIIMASPAEAAAAGLQLPPSAAGTTATAAVAEGAAASRIHAEGGGHGGGGGAVLLLRDFILLPLAFYAAWAALYYFKIFVWSADRIRRLGYHTLFSHITAQRQGVFYEIARRVPQRLHAPAYLLFHLTYCLVTFLIAAACWRNYVLHSLLLVTMVSVSIWHGANFYFTVFLRKHQQQLVAAAAAAAAATTVSSPAAPDVQNRQLLRQ